MAPNWPALVFFRLMTGVGAAGPPTVVGGLLVDIYLDLRDRGNAIMLLSVAGMIGSLVGPMVAGSVSTVGWRWMFWVALMASGVSWPFLSFLPGQEAWDLEIKSDKLIKHAETYGPVILARYAHLRRIESGNPNILAPIELKKKSLKKMITVVLTRPIRMFIEPIVLCTCLFLALDNAMLYLYFEGYPIIFQGM